MQLRFCTRCSEIKGPSSGRVVLASFPRRKKALTSSERLLKKCLVPALLLSHIIICRSHLSSVKMIVISCQRLSQPSTGPHDNLLSTCSLIGFAFLLWNPRRVSFSRAWSTLNFCHKSPNDKLWQVASRLTQVFGNVWAWEYFQLIVPWLQTNLSDLYSAACHHVLIYL